MSKAESFVVILFGEFRSLDWGAVEMSFWEMAVCPGGRGEAGEWES